MQDFNKLVQLGVQGKGDVTQYNVHVVHIPCLEDFRCISLCVCGVCVHEHAQGFIEVQEMIQQETVLSSDCLINDCTDPASTVTVP